MQRLFDICFHNCSDELFVEYALDGVKAQRRDWCRLKELSSQILDTTERTDCYFAPALRKKHGVMGKENFACSHVAWVDYDDTQLPLFLVEPSAIVATGGGFHLYWRLNIPCDHLEMLERLNVELAQCIGGDSAHNADRILRIPGTINSKYEHNNLVTILQTTENEYDIHELLTIVSMDQKLRAKILTGDSRGFKTRSERDWFIVKGLLKHGVSDDWIVRLFERHACGEKIRERNGEHYLGYTIGRAKEELIEDAAFLIQRPDGYYTKTRNALRRVSTFIMNPTALLVDENDNDSILCDISADGSLTTWNNQIVPQSALTTVRALSKIANKAAWSWLGNDSDVRLLRAHLIKQLQEDGMRTIKATSTLGYHEVGGERFFVGSNFIAGCDGKIWDGTEHAPIIYTSPPQRVPKIIQSATSDSNFLGEIAQKLHCINVPDVIWPMLGWFMATPLKPAIEKCGYRFPILNVFGTRGSGKSTTILRVFQPLLGYEQERTYDANTTRFVVLSLLGCSNAVPISFSEFRASNTGSFMRYVLLSYDSGRDPRGRSDQTTIDYPLTAPFVIDGEDMLDDPAAMERIVAVHLNPHDIREGTSYWRVFQEIQSVPLNHYILPYIKFVLKVDVSTMLKKAELQISKVLTDPLPPRIRKNLIVTWFGVLIYRSFIESIVEAPKWNCDPSVLERALAAVYSTTLGRAPTAADDFIETIINAAAGGLKVFPWKFADDVFWFQLTPAFNFYANQKARLRKSTLSRQAIRSQLMELLEDYVVEPQKRNLYGSDLWVYGIDLKRAHAGGLDVPASVTKGRPNVRLKKK